MMESPENGGINLGWEDTVPETGEKDRKQERVPDYRTVLIQRTIRSGQVIRYPGNVVVMGDVNPGAEIVAGGSIVVMGSLRGVAHAGAGGNTRSIVAAFRLRPTQLRIANHITRSPDEEEWQPEQPEVAHVKDGVVLIDPYITTGEEYLSVLKTGEIDFKKGKNR